MDRRKPDLQIGARVEVRRRRGRIRAGQIQGRIDDIGRGDIGIARPRQLHGMHQFAGFGVVVNRQDQTGGGGGRDREPVQFNNDGLALNRDGRRRSTAPIALRERQGNLVSQLPSFNRLELNDRSASGIEIGSSRRHRELAVSATAHNLNRAKRADVNLLPLIELKGQRLRRNI